MPEATHTKRLGQYNKAFKEDLKKLNAEQKMAVDQIDGPVMVIAGPGTGKTHILSARIGRILLDTDTQAHNILCLTFTDAGVQAMRNRLLEFIGPEAHRVHIYTFHSFCNSIIQDRLDLFGYHDMEPVSELEKVEIIREIIDSLPIDHLLKKGRANDPYYYERHLADLFSRMKSENWEVDFIESKIQSYLESLPTREEYIYKKKTKNNIAGDLKQAKFNESKDRMDLLSSAIILFQEYVKNLQKAHRYDFDDMILWVLDAFEKHPALLRNYQEQYLYVLVDEFQDTNGAQNEIVQSLINYWESPNIFLVGDDDQSIFEFQGARLKNLIDFHIKYKDELSLVLLQKNYRSNQSILDVSKNLIDNNQKRIVNQIEGLDKKLKASNKDILQSKQVPLIVQYPNRFHEETDIVAQIQELQNTGVSLDEVAIIYAKHKQAVDLIRLLEKKEIPYKTRRQVNILHLPMIQNLRVLLTYIKKEYESPFAGEHLLFQILHFNFIGIKAMDLAVLNAYMAKIDYKVRPHWRAVINDEDILQDLQLSNPQVILNFANFINQMIKDSGSLNLITLIERIINKSGLLRFIIGHKEKTWFLQVNNTFFNFVKKESDRNPRLKLSKFLETLSNMDANRIALPIQKTVLSKTGVNLVTAHGSKGLEFKYVYLLDCSKDAWEGKNYRGSRFKFPDTLTLSGEEDVEESRRRLFYVALTRAKTHLQVSFSEKNANEKVTEKCRFIDELLENSGLEITHRALEDDQILESKFLILEENTQPQIKENDKAFVESILEHFTLSISNLNSYLRCPLSFYYEHILKVPSSTSVAAAYGTAMHEALRKLFDKMKNDPEKQFGSSEDLIWSFENEMKGLEFYFPKSDFDMRMELGKINLKSYYHNHIEQWPKNVQIEHYVNNVEVEGIPIKGTIDRVDLLNQNMVHIVDYKSGSHNSKKTVKVSKTNELGGDYWRQLVFYKILYESKYSGSEVLSAEISYLEADKNNKFKTTKITFGNADKSTVTSIIKNTYTKIKAHDFYKGCGEKNCSWCNFVKNTSEVESFADEATALLDD